MAVVLSGCFTGALWGFTPDDESTSTDQGTTLTYDDETEWSWGLLFKRVALTPFAFALDMLTCPVQAILLGRDDDEDRKTCNEDPRKLKPQHRH